MTSLNWSNCTVALGDLKPWADNPRFSTKAQAKRILDSFKRFDQVLPIAIGPANEVYDGHQRLSALLTIHGKNYEIDARRSNRALSDDERRALTLAINGGAVGGWNWDALANWDASVLKGEGFDADMLAELNASAANLAAMLEADKPAPVDDVEPPIDRAEELREKWGVETGQLWQLGEHRLICGDCTDRAVVERVMGGDEPDLINADPPYGVSIVAANVSVGGGEAYKIPFGGVKAKRLGSVGGAKPFGSRDVRGSDRAANIVDVGKYAPIIGDDTTDTAKRSVALYVDMFPSAVHVWWGANYYTEALSPSPCWLVWNKETTGNFADCELAWTNQDRSAKLFTHRWNGMLRDSERERRWHPTQKPAALAAWIFETFTAPGGIVLDPFSGGGWSILGADAIGRKCRAIEMSADYVAVALERWSLATGKTPELLDAS